MHELSKKERLARQARGLEIDRVPTIGGWIGGAHNLARLAGLTAEAYLADPTRGMILAHRALDVDGMIQAVVPQSLEQIRTGMVLDGDFAQVEPEALLERAKALPDREQEVLASFDARAEERYYRDYFETAFKTWGDIQPVGNFWEIGGHFPLYNEFGYTAFLTACALYPEAVGKIWWAKSLHSRQRAKILVRLYKEYDLAPLMFCGEDLCNNSGPMVSPAFLREHYLPTVQMIIAPLVEAGVRLIYHCDGDVRALVEDYVAIGFSGFQGFQYELGVDPYALRKLRSRRGEEPLFFAGLSVSRTLPFGRLEDIRDEIDYFLDFTDGGKGLYLITSNVTGVEVPPENLRFAYRYVKEWDLSQSCRPRWHAWPGFQKEYLNLPPEVGL